MSKAAIFGQPKKIRQMNEMQSFHKIKNILDPSCMPLPSVIIAMGVKKLNQAKILKVGQVYGERGCGVGCQ